MSDNTSSAKTRLIGKRFNKLTVNSFSHQDSYSHVFWKCSCDCGGSITTSTRQLQSNRTTSCGCIRDALRKATGARNRGWKGVGELSAVYFGAAKLGATRRGLEFSVTIEQCWQLFLAQHRKCKLSGLALQFKTSRDSKNGTASLDRIDSTKGYTLDNLQWVHKDVNQMKMELNQDYFLSLVKAIAANQNIR